jgi:hypothetical protein
MEELLHTLVGDDIEFSPSLAPDLGHISADRSELEQVITALVVNARDALPMGGAVRLETSDTLVDANESGQLPEPQVVLTVCATGYGGQPILCPPSIDAIVARYGGHLRASTEPEKSSTLRIYLPRVEPTDRPEAPAEGTSSSLEEE